MKLLLEFSDVRVGSETHVRLVVRPTRSVYSSSLTDANAPVYVNAAPTVEAVLGGLIDQVPYLVASVKAHEAEVELARSKEGA